MASIKPVERDAPVGMPCRLGVGKGPAACSTASTTPSTAPAMAHAISTRLRSISMAAFPFPLLVSAHCTRSAGLSPPDRKVGPRVAEMRLKMGQHGALGTPGFGKLLPEVFSTYAFGKGKKPWPKNR